MRLQLTKTECRWLADLANKAKTEANTLCQESWHSLAELRRDNMADLEAKLNDAIQREIQRERSGARGF
jgi:hypothetical protein